MGAKAGWPGAITWGAETIGDTIQVTRGSIPREFKFIGKPPQWWAFMNTAGSIKPINPRQITSPERLEEVVRKAKEAGMPVVGANISEGENVDAWVNDALAAEKGGADFLELNYSCPYVPGIGLVIGVNLELQRAVIKAIKDKCGLPVMAKLNAALSTETLIESAKGCVVAGVDAISTTNAIAGSMGVDIETARPHACDLDETGKLSMLSGGVSGPAIKPIGLRAVAELRSEVDVPICGIGGISEWESAVEYMMLGANVVQLCTAVMIHGFPIIKGLVSGLEAFMERKGYRRIEDFVGIVSKKYPIGAFGVEKQPRKMIIDEAKCTGCGLCLRACEASYSQLGEYAMRIEDGLAKIDYDRCLCCNCCMFACPTGAISVEWEPAYSK